MNTRRVLGYQTNFPKFKNRSGINLCITLLFLALVGNAQSDFEIPTSSLSLVKPFKLSSNQNAEPSSSYGIDFEKIAAGIQYDSTFVRQKLKKQSQTLFIFGYYRLFLYGRNMVESYPNLHPYERTYSVGDGYREPMLSMNIVGRPGSKSSFGTELFIVTPYSGIGYQENVISMNLGINFYGQFRTDAGNFSIRAGGIHWYNLSPFTIGVFQVLDRFSIFDRTPWEGVTNLDKYESYYSTGNTNAGDLRWNNQAFQGLILNGNKLPGGFRFDLFIGKTQPNGGLPGAISDPFESISPTSDAGSVPTYLGFSGDARYLPNLIQGGKLGRSFGKASHYFSYNVISSHSAIDSIGSDFRSYRVHSLELKVKLNRALLTGELAMGNYQSPSYSKTWGEALMLKLQLPILIDRIPFDAQIYQIDNDFFNQNSEIATGSNKYIAADFAGTDPESTQAMGLIAVVNQLVPNRRGLNLTTGYDDDLFKLKFGWGLAREIVASSTALVFYHRINSLALSRIYNPFPANATGPVRFGPYNRKTSVFRGITETVQLTDLNPGTAEALTKKYFASIDLQAKTKAVVVDRTLYLFYLGSFCSAKSSANPLPSFETNTYLSIQYHELDLYFELLPKFILSFYAGLEYAQGGNKTLWNDESKLPLNQFGKALGIGFDWTIAENAGLFFRMRSMQFEDKSFVLDTYKGTELTLELKTFF